MTGPPFIPSYLAAYDFYSHVEYAIIEPMIAWLCQGRPPYVLDAGCGNGRDYVGSFSLRNRGDIQVELVQIGDHLVGVDPHGGCQGMA